MNKIIKCFSCKYYTNKPLTSIYNLNMCMKYNTFFNTARYNENLCGSTFRNYLPRIKLNKK